MTCLFEKTAKYSTFYNEAQYRVLQNLIQVKKKSINYIPNAKFRYKLFIYFYKLHMLMLRKSGIRIVPCVRNGRMIRSQAEDTDNDICRYLLVFQYFYVQSDLLVVDEYLILKKLVLAIYF